MIARLVPIALLVAVAAVAVPAQANPCGVSPCVWINHTEDAGTPIVECTAGHEVRYHNMDSTPTYYFGEDGAELITYGHPWLLTSRC